MNIQHAIDEFLMFIKIEKNYSDHTVNGYSYDLESFKEFLVRHRRSLELTEITRATVRRYIQEQVSKYQIKPRTINRRISCLKSFVGYCLRENIIETDFMAGIDTPKMADNLPVYMTLLELQQLFRFLENNALRLRKRNELMFKLLATTGMRRSEILNLKWEQVNLSNSTLRVAGKGKKERLLPLHPIVIPLFSPYMDTLQEYQLHGTEPVFLNKNGNKLDPRGLHKTFKEILEKAGLPPKRFSLHHLRHTFATLLLQENKENVDLRIVQELLGHESLVTTQIYTHVDFEQKKKAIDSFKIS